MLIVTERPEGNALRAGMAAEATAALLAQVVARRPVRRLGIGAVNAIPPLKNRFMAEARGESGTLPKLLEGMRV